MYGIALVWISLVYFHAGQCCWWSLQNGGLLCGGPDCWLAAAIREQGKGWLIDKLICNVVADCRHFDGLHQPGGTIHRRGCSHYLYREKKWTPPNWQHASEKRQMHSPWEWVHYPEFHRNWPVPNRTVVIFIGCSWPPGILGEMTFSNISSVCWV